MDNIKNKIKLFIVVLFSCLLVTGCTTSIEFTYDVSTGDRIKVKLNTTDEYKLSAKSPFTISKGDKGLSTGTFITLDGYEKYVNAVYRQEDVQILDSGNKDGNDYILYSYNNKNFNYVIRVGESNTGILLENINSKSEAEEVFNLLTFSER